MWQLFYYKMWQKFIKKCDSFITKCDSDCKMCYKLWQYSKNSTVHPLKSICNYHYHYHLIVFLRVFLTVATLLTIVGITDSYVKSITLSQNNPDIYEMPNLFSFFLHWSQDLMPLYFLMTLVVAALHTQIL